MDTRSKVLSAAEAAATLEPHLASLRIVTGYFDPVYGPHAQRLAGIVAAQPATRLAIVLFDPPAPLLPASARAELLAAFRGVDWVVLPPADDTAPHPLRALLAGASDESAADLERRRDLIALVHQRQQQAAAG